VADEAAAEPSAPVVADAADDQTTGFGSGSSRITNDAPRVSSTIARIVFSCRRRA